MAQTSRMAREVEIQRSYYAENADQYDDAHGSDNHEHNFALAFMFSAVRFMEVRSILDIGSGTGRALLAVKRELKDVPIIGIEPSAELRRIGHAKGLMEAELIDGDAMKLSFPDDSFDLVCEFGALHHIPEPSKAIAEMLRVARKGIFISDCNNFGQGSSSTRFLKQSFHALGLWPLIDRVKTNGKGYTLSEGDGLAYSFSVFNDYKLIQSACVSVHLLNTHPAGPNLYRTASHVALLGIKQPRPC